MKLEIRKANINDINKIYKLGMPLKAFSSATSSFWTKEQLKSWCNSENDQLLVAIMDTRIVGFSFYAAHVPTGKVTWENLYVDPAFQEKGIGKALIEEGLKQLKKKGYKYVMCLNNSADKEKTALYFEKFGFKRGEIVLWMDQFINE